MRDGSVVTNPEIDDPNIFEPLDMTNDTVKLLKITRVWAKDIYLVNFGTHFYTVSNNKTSGGLEVEKRIIELHRAGRANELPYREMALIAAVCISVCRPPLIFIITSLLRS